MNDSVEITLTSLKPDIIELIECAASILITSIKSDDDAIASVLALYSFLKIKYPHKKLKMAICSYKNDLVRCSGPSS